MSPNKEAILGIDNRSGLEVLFQTEFRNREAQDLWTVVGDAFKELELHASVDQAPSKEEFMFELFSESVINLILRRQNGQIPVGYMGIHTKTDALLWLNSGLIETYFEKPEKEGSFFYNSALAI